MPTPTAARRGVDCWQIDSSAELIRGLEKLGLVYDVRWPSQERVDARRAKPAGSAS